MSLNIIEILIIFIAGLALGGFLPRLRERAMADAAPDAESYQPEETLPQLKAPNLLRAAPPLIAKQKEKKDANKQAILGAFAWAENGRLTGADVEKMLGVSDSTALRYLDELIAEGKITKETGPDRRTFYLKVESF